jgi:hypothetical protein
MKGILDLDSKSAVTIFSSIKISRDNPREELGMVDLENCISQAIWKLFDTSRSEAAERLRINEVDLLLTDARVMQMKIDGHQIINPHGFTGKELEVLLAVTMVKRDSFLEESNPFEGGVVRAYLLGKEIGCKKALYIELGKKWTTLFLVQPSHISYLSEFEWGLENVIDALKGELGVSDNASRDIYLRFTEGLVSDHIAKTLEKIFYKAFGEFINGVTLNINNSPDLRSGKAFPMYLRPFFPVPESVYTKRFSFDGKSAKFLTVGDIVDLQLFVDDEVHEIYRELNELAKRRIKWLMPTA